MSIPLPFRKHNTCDETRQDWIDERRREARIVVADVVHHSDRLIRLACNVLARHGETPAEREDARILLVMLEAKSPRRSHDHRTDREDRR